VSTPSLRVASGSNGSAIDTVEIRPLERDDRAGLAAAVERLSPRARYLRFASPKPRLTERDLDRLTDIDHHQREALLAIDPRTREGIAVARYAELPGEPGVVDVAVTVGDAWQGRGLGSALLARLLARAREEGHRAARADVLAENAGSRAMLRSAGFHGRGSTGGLLELELPLVDSGGAV
jgi:RimJ/RimL family protein N-acetyltransferase